jgi:hypothetical protein
LPLPGFRPFFCFAPRGTLSGNAGIVVLRGERGDLLPLGDLPGVLFDGRGAFRYLGGDIIRVRWFPL